MRKWILAMALAVLAGVIAAACGGTPGQDTNASSSSAADTSGATSEAMGANPFAKYGDITLKVVSADNQDPGPKPVIEELAKQFTAMYPNVKVQVDFKGFSDYIKVIKLQLASNDAPDVAEGNQGWQIDGALVKSKLILPLTDQLTAMGWKDWYTPDTFQQFEWADDGSKFGNGTVYGVGQFGQSTGIFYNKKILASAGIDPTAIKTFDDFAAAVKTLRDKLPTDQPVINIGNKDGYEIVHAWGMLQGAYSTDPQAIRNWVFQQDGATFDNSENIQAMKVLKEWVDANYFGTDFNAVGENDAAAAFAKGTGAFYMGGNWQAGVIKDGLGADAGFMDGPPGVSGKHIAIGSTSLPWHISSKSKYPDVAAAFINYLINGEGSAQLMYDQVQIPAVQTAPQPQGDAYLGQVATGWQDLVKDGGLTLFLDWSSPSMYDTLGAEFQKLAAGEATPEEVAKAVQADWQKFHDTLK
jgi:raffinose/stachyose/melibiose transport system substrate-binding protein